MRGEEVVARSPLNRKRRLRWSWIGILALAGWITLTPPAVAQRRPLPLLTPITRQEPDPLVPEAVLRGDRPLTAEEAQGLAVALDALRQEGVILDAQGQSDAAYEIWVREVRLRQFLGPQAELEGLNWLGQRAWIDDRTPVLRGVGDRLVIVEAQILENPPNLDLWLTIAQTYETVRQRDPAIAAYERILDYSRQQRDGQLERSTLETLGQLYLNWFRYADAARIYAELAQQVRQQGTPMDEAAVLERLAYAYERDGQYAAAIATQERLIELYTAEAIADAPPTRLNQVQVMPLPRLSIAIANNYRALRRYDRAARSYQTALTAAQLSQQFGYASDALRQLAELYKSIERWEDAVVAYEGLVTIEQQSYSVYGMMRAYDELGRIHRSQGQVREALVAFEQGLRLAQQLGFREAYFQAQLRSLRPPLRPFRRPVMLEESEAESNGDTPAMDHNSTP
jgi:tetratricopeptide (TPR) repeat protein